MPTPQRRRLGQTRTRIPRIIASTAEIVIEIKAILCLVLWGIYNDVVWSNTTSPIVHLYDISLKL